MKMKILKGLFVAVLMASTLAKADTPSVHGMLLFGDKVSYASHLPMFHSPHDYQLIMKLTLHDHGSETLNTYKQAKADGAMLFTLVPEVMDLSQLIDGTKKSFVATIFEGHFEQGGNPLGEIAVNVESIVFAEKLNGNQVLPFEYFLVFGGLGEYYGAHIIKVKPSYDAIMSVSQPVEMNFGNCPGRGDCMNPVIGKVSDSDLPLTLSSTLQILPKDGDFLGSPYGIHVSIDKIIYLEESELAH
jgi:hypothetical protein